jgi:hypothetical protein
MVPDGTIAIAEFVVDGDRRGPMNGLIFAVNMLVNTEVGKHVFRIHQSTAVAWPGPFAADPRNARRIGVIC